MKRTVIFCVILQLAEWLIFLYCDYQEEHGGETTPEPFMAIVILTFVTVSALLLICLSMRNSVQICGRKMHPVLLAGIWYACCMTTFAAAMLLLRFDLEPIPQHHTGSSLDLNGIEYGLFPVNNLIAGCGVLLLTPLIRFLFSFIKAVRSNSR